MNGDNFCRLYVIIYLFKALKSTSSITEKLLHKDCLYKIPVPIGTPKYEVFENTDSGIYDVIVAGLM